MLRTSIRLACALAHAGALLWLVTSEPPPYPAPAVTVLGVGLTTEGAIALTTLLAGVAIGRWWALLVPLGLGLVGIVDTMGPAEPESEWTPGEARMFIAAMTLALVLIGAAGVGVQKGAVGIRAERGSEPAGR